MENNSWGYPHFLALKQAPALRYSVDGNVLSEDEQWLALGVCRAELKAGGKVESAHGSGFAFQYAIYSPIRDARLSLGAIVRVMEGEQILLEKAIERVEQGAFHVGIWV